MKIRNDYVSNSSSSSFIVIAKTGVDKTQKISDAHRTFNDGYDVWMFPNEDYKTTFGWEWENTCTFRDKLNFIGLQLLYLLLEKMNGRMEAKRPHVWGGKDFDRLYNMVQKVCREKFHFDARLNTKPIVTRCFANSNGEYSVYTDLSEDYYIDH